MLPAHAPSAGPVPMQHYELIVVGAGIMGLAHAYHAARKGMRVGVFDRHPRANGASVRNFGMLAIVAQSQGKQFDDAVRSLAHWQHISKHAGVQLQQTGCLIAARYPQEMDVLQEYVASPGAQPQARLVERSSMPQHCAGLKMSNIIGGLWNENAWKVDQQRAIHQIALWLEREFAVSLHFSTDVTGVETGFVSTVKTDFHCDNVIVCAGNDFATLFPDEFAATGVVHCQLQMMRTRPQPGAWKLNCFVLGGLSLPRYAAFSGCDSLAGLKALQASKFTEYVSNGIHIILCQEPDGSVTIGDSHHYQDTACENRAESIDRLLLNEAANLLDIPDPAIGQRWCGHYAHLADTDLLHLTVAPGVIASTMTNGQGMTHAFAHAEDVISEITKGH